jgi:hypothetical protein
MEKPNGGNHDHDVSCNLIDAPALVSSGMLRLPMPQEEICGVLRCHYTCVVEEKAWLRIVVG